MKFLYRFIVLFALLGCTTDDAEVVNAISSSYQVKGDRYLFTADPVKYQRLDFNRKDPSQCTIEYQVNKISRTGDELTLEILRPKGCNGTYELVWDGQWQESSPKRMQIYLTAEFPTCTSTSEKVTDLVRVDLTKAIRTTEPAGTFAIYLREHCSFKDFNCQGDCLLTIPG